MGSACSSPVAVAPPSAPPKTPPSPPPSPLPKTPPSPPPKPAAAAASATAAARADPAHSAYFISRLLDVVEQDIVPKTAAAVKEGNKLFGAAIMRKCDMSCVCADTNRETEWPLLHGEVSCLRTLNSLPAEQRTPAKDCFFVATHEPCSLCLSAITWSGYDNFYHLFSYEDTRDAFGIPHDLKILKEVFNCDQGRYGRDNAYWKCHSIAKLVEEVPLESERRSLQLRMTTLRERYNQMSEVYQASKGSNNIPLC